MTWRASSKGPRVLTRDETNLFCYTILALIRLTRFRNIFELPLPMVYISQSFNGLGDSAILAILEKTCRGLMEDTGDYISELTWYNESAILYIYNSFGYTILYPLLHFLKDYQNVEMSQHHSNKLKILTDCAKDLVKLLKTIIGSDHFEMLKEDENLLSGYEEKDDDTNTDEEEFDLEKLTNAFQIEELIDVAVDAILWDRDFEDGMMELFGRADDKYYADYQEDRAYPHKGASERLFNYARERYIDANREDEWKTISPSNFKSVLDILYMKRDDYEFECTI